jgi:hypothetical protein
MTSFTFSAAQVRSAPAGVRQWIENEVAANHLAPNRVHSQPPSKDLANLEPCTLDEVARIFEAIREDVAATRVFLELAREAPVGVDTQPLHALSIREIMSHTQLNDGRLVDCFRAINQAFQQIRNNPEAALFGFDQANHVYIHETTHRSIRALWEQLAWRQAPPMTAATAPTASSVIGFMPPYVAPENPAAPEMATRASAPLTGSIRPPAARSAAPAPAVAGTPTPGMCPVPSVRIRIRRPLPDRHRGPLKRCPTLRRRSRLRSKRPPRGDRRRRRIPPYRRGSKGRQQNRRPTLAAGQIRTAGRNPTLQQSEYLVQ